MPLIAIIDDQITNRRIYARLAASESIEDRLQSTRRCRGVPVESVDRDVRESGGE